VVVARYHVSADPDLADAASGTVILSVPHAEAHHNGGNMLFGPADGDLFIGLGDGSPPGSPTNNAQNPSLLLGKMLRINVEAGNPMTYTVPPSNPFAGRPGYRPEIWATGLRNPWRFAFDGVTHNLYIGDVGQSNYEEIDFQPAASLGGDPAAPHRRWPLAGRRKSKPRIARARGLCYTRHVRASGCAGAQPAQSRTAPGPGRAG
jgi:hypothetical protein